MPFCELSTTSNPGDNNLHSKGTIFLSNPSGWVDSIVVFQWRAHKSNRITIWDHTKIMVLFVRMCLGDRHDSGQEISSVVMTLVSEAHEICSSSLFIALRVTDRWYSFPTELMLQPNNCKDCFIARQILVLSNVVQHLRFPFLISCTLINLISAWAMVFPSESTELVIYSHCGVEHTIGPSDVLTLSIWCTCWTINLL